MTNLTQPQLFSIARGESLMAALSSYAKQHHIPSASLTGLGALQNITLGYFNFQEKKYQYKTFEGIYELITLTGNITKFNNEYVVHAHVALSDENYQLIGGHLQEAVVAVTAEMTLFPLSSTICRQFDSKIQLNLISNE
jgi:predicted DNA-binding protein with PD1-like motif